MPIDMYLFTRDNFYLDNEESTTREEKMAHKLDFLKSLSPLQTGDRDKCPPAIYYDFGLKENMPPRMNIDNKYLAYVCENKLIAKQAKITGYLSDGVALDDGSVLEADVIVCCTGYLPDLTFFGQSVLDNIGYAAEFYRFPILFYKWTFHPELENAAFICQNLGTFFIGSLFKKKSFTKNIKDFQPFQQMYLNWGQLHPSVHFL